MALKSVLGDLKKQKTPSNKPAPERPEIDEASRKVLGDQARKVKEMILSDIRSGNRGRLDSNFSYMAAAAGAPQQMRFTSPTEDNAKEWWAEAKKYGGSAKKNATTAENGYEPLDSGKKEKETTIGSLEARKINAENALNSFDQNADYDWTDAGSRKSHEEKRKQLEKAVEMAGAELAKKEAENTQRKDMEEIGSMSEEAKRHLKALTNQNSFTMNNTLGMTGGQIVERMRGQDQAKEYLRSMGYSDQRINELASTYSRQLNEEFSQRMQSEAQEIADTPGMRGVANIVSPVLSAAGGVIGTMETATAGLSRMLGNGDTRYQNLDPNLPGYSPSNINQTIRGETARQISGDEYDENGVKVKDGGALRQLASYGYQGGMSLADSLFQAAAGGGPAGGAALAAANSYSQTVQQASQQGATPEEANALGVTIAGIEFLSEKIPMERMFKTAKSGNTNIFAEALRQANIEASTEEISMISSKVAEAAILRDKSSYKQQIGDLVASGMSYEEAKKQADKAFWKEFGETMIISGISGGISGGGSAYVGNQQNAVADVSEDTGPELLDGPEMAETEQEAQTPTPDFISDTAAQLAQEAPAQQTPQLTPEQEQFDRAAAETLGVQLADGTATSAEEKTVVNTAPEATPPDPMSMSEEDFLDSMGSDRGGAEADPFADRSWHEVGKRSEKAFMHQNPEVKPLFQQEAAMLYSELGDTIKGERTFNGDAYYQSGGEAGWSGTKRHTSESIADLLDNGFTYGQIEKGLMSIMEDHGAENNAAAKRIEFIINDRLLNGYTSFYDGSRVPPNADYVKFANGQSAPDTDTKNPSAEGGHRFEAMGAADAGFSGKPAYNATLSETNRQADRRDDVRPMELPKTDVNGNPVSATTGNVYASKLIPDDFASLMEESVARGDFSYMKLTNDRATKMAAENIGKCGAWEDAYRQFTSDVDSGKAGAELAARGAILLNQAAQMGDDNRRLSILADLQQLGTNTAQGLQAMRLIRSLNPPDKIKFIEMMVRRMDHDMKLGGELKVDKALMQEYYSAKTDKARDAVVEKIQQNVANQIPSTFMDKFTALRYVNMLGNLKTNVRNVAGNVGSNLMYKVKDGVATGIEAMTHKLTGAERTKSLFVGDKDLMKACKEDFAQVSDLVGGGGKYGDKMSAYGQFQQGVMDKRQIFKFKPMEGYRKATNWAMNNDKFGDEAFGRAAYSRALAGYLKANGMTGAEFRQVVETGKGNTALVDRARAYAVQQAQEMTFHDNTAMARIMSKLQKAGGPLGQGIMPFTKTPANVLTRAEEFSPLGFINSTVKTIQKARGNVDITGADLIDSWSKSITGSGIFAIGAYLMSQGLLTGAPDDDEEKAAFDKLNGVQSYALQLPDGTSYTIDWMTPAAMPLFMGGELMKIIEEDGQLNFSDLERVFTSIADPMIQMSMMQGINDSLDSIKYADNNLGQFCLNAGLNYLLQGVSNTMLGQLEKSTEENRTTTYVDKDSSTPQWMQRQLGKLSQKIPGWDYQQTDYLDAWGEEQKNVGGTGAGGMAYNLLSPGYLSKEKTSELNDELYRLHESTGENVFPQSAEKTVTYTDTSGADHKDYNLSAEEFSTMQKEEGQTAQRLLSQIVGNKDYKALTDAQRAAVVADVYKYAREQGRKAALPGYYSEAAGWIKSMGKDPANAIIQRAALGEVNNAVSSAVDSIENGWNVTDANRKELDSFYDSFKGMSKEAQSKILDEAISDTAKYLEMRRKGISTDKYLGAVREIKSLKPEPTYSGVRDIQVREAISGSHKLSEKEKDIVMKAYMPDYNPDAKSPQTTELKYDAIRGLGVSPSGYTDAYRAYLDASGTGKRRRTIAQYQKDYGWDRATAQKVYDIYAGYYKPWNDAQSADPQNASGSGGVSVEDLKRLIR